AGPGGRAADGAEGARVGLAVLQEEAEDAAAVGAGEQGVGGQVQFQVMYLDIGHAVADALPGQGGGGAGRQLPHPVVIADVQIAVARIEDQFPGRQAGQVAAQIAPALAGVDADHDVPAAAAGDAADRVDRVAVARIDLEVYDASQADQV